MAVSALHFASSSVGSAAPPSVHADLEMVSRTLEYIDELLTGMLDFSKVAAGKIHLHPERFSLVRDVLTPLVHMLGGGRSGPSGAGGPTLFVEESVLQGDPLWVEVDALRLKQVCVNLAKNALKFVPAGFVRMGAKRCVEGGWVEVYIEDSGPGIPRSKAESIFDKFAQVNSHDNGTGIGLALCREITEAMGGSVKVDTTYASESEFGPGTRFVVVLPLPEVAELAVPKATAQEDPDLSLEPQSSLPKEASALNDVVEDDEDSCPRGAYRALVVAENKVLRAETARALKTANGDKWWVEEVANENLSLSAAVAATARCV